MPEPNDQAALRRFLGMVNYISRFVPHLSDLCAPLREITNRGEGYWQWDSTATKAFSTVKAAVADALSTKYFDPKLTTVIPCDASSTGLGAALMQAGEPVAFASRALSKTEQNYCQLEKELLAIVFATHHFDQYIHGRHVCIQSDHKPLEILLEKHLKDAPRRIQRMMLELQRYDLTIEYRKGESLYLADTLSRAYLPVTTCEYDADERICHFTTREELTEIDARKEVHAVSDQRLVEVEEHTKKDANMCKLIDIINRGWPDKKTDIPCDLQSYFNIRD